MTALSIIGDREALAWVLGESRMAFPARQARVALDLRSGDRLLLYTTRGCFHNPGRDRGRIIGSARVKGPVERLSRPVVIAERKFPVGCDLVLEQIAPYGDGVELQPLVTRLSVFPDPATWSAWMRRALLVLPPKDAALLSRQLGAVATESAAPTIAAYVATAEGGVARPAWSRAEASVGKRRKAQARSG